MSSMTDINIVLSQGTAVKEVQNVRKQTLDLNQQYVVQQAEVLRKEDKNKVLEPKAGDQVEISQENEMKNMKNRKGRQNDFEEDADDEETEPLGDHIIDIKV